MAATGIQYNRHSCFPSIYLSLADGWAAREFALPQELLRQLRSDPLR